MLNSIWLILLYRMLRWAFERINDFYREKIWTIDKLCEVKDKIDLEMVNHLSGKTRKFIEIGFRTL